MVDRLSNFVCLFECHARVHGQAQDLIVQALGEWQLQVAEFRVGVLPMRGDGVMNQGLDAGPGQLLLQLFALFAEHHKQVPHMLLLFPPGGKCYGGMLD
ncbi:hypothetical protein D3C71_1998250 [compost metagenome]